MARIAFDPGLLAASQNATADMTVTTTPTALPALPAVSAEGILVLFDIDNDTAARCRIASNADGTHGIVLAPGQSWTFKVQDASVLKVCLRSAVGGAAVVIAQQA